MKKYSVLLLACLLAASVQAKLRLPALVGDNMVLQRDATVNLWGWAEPDSKVAVKLSWDRAIPVVTADKSGAWMVKVNTPGAGGPHTVTIAETASDRSKNDNVTLKNIAIGEVWICTGQSNMEMPVKGFSGQPIDGAMDVILNSGQYKELIRHINVGRVLSQTPLDDVKGEWLCASASTTGDFGAAAYFFAVNLVEELGVPVGLIRSSWGGSGIEAWMNLDAMQKVDHFPIEGYSQSNKHEHHAIGNIYYGMVAPLFNYVAKGFLWYQGESNISRYQYYAQQMQQMVELWRTQWSDGAQMPFYYVQIAPYTYDPGARPMMPFLMEAQQKALALIPNSGMISTSDLGNEFCIHPPQKKDVGLRLALLALKGTYGVKLPSYFETPKYKEFSVKDGKVTVTFDCAGAFTPYPEITGFEVAGADKVFHPAQAKVVPYKPIVELTCEQVKEPVAVRYCFKDYLPCNLKNVVGIGAYPFRTDDWPLEK